ncbi:16 kDa protein [Persimmon virus B]|uniref:16 kDa protein n=1 Tax=Persimmon virus B TaxID=1493829 RepID=A0A0A8JBT1_9CLOS|nr:16 kDa protein [Persimmon virus B]BAQ08214.1 16 kDa protein [Persimmon virus B]
MDVLIIHTNNSISILESCIPYCTGMFLYLELENGRYHKVLPDGCISATSCRNLASVLKNAGAESFLAITYKYSLDVYDYNNIAEILDGKKLKIKTYFIDDVVISTIEELKVGEVDESREIIFNANTINLNGVRFVIPGVYK